MAGRIPDYRVMFVEDNGKGRKTWFKVGAAPDSCVARTALTRSSTKLLLLAWLELSERQQPSPSTRSPSLRGQPS
jgi:hypothetical protein